MGKRLRWMTVATEVDVSRLFDLQDFRQAVNGRLKGDEREMDNGIVGVDEVVKPKRQYAARRPKKNGGGGRGGE